MGWGVTQVQGVSYAGNFRKTEPNFRFQVVFAWLRSMCSLVFTSREIDPIVNRIGRIFMWNIFNREPGTH